MRKKKTSKNLFHTQICVKSFQFFFRKSYIINFDGCKQILNVKFFISNVRNGGSF